MEKKFNVTYENESKMACFSDWDDEMTETTVLYACNHNGNRICAYSYNIMIGEYPIHIIIYAGVLEIYLLTKIWQYNLA